MTSDHAGQYPGRSPAPGAGGQGTSLAVMLGAGDEVRSAVAGWVGGALGNVPKTVRSSALDEVMSAVNGLLEASVIDTMIAGWRTHRDLTAAARRTLEVPGSTELVQLVDHQITVTEQPYVTVLVDGGQVARLDLQLSLTFDISALLAVIRGGRMIALHSGHCDITAALAIHAMNVITRQTQLELPGLISMPEGIRLLPADAYPADSAA